MSSCKDCVHYELCKDDVELHHDFYDCLEEDGVEKHCEYFKPQSRFVELPCEVGQTVYHLAHGYCYEEHIRSVYVEYLTNGYSFSNKDIGVTVFIGEGAKEKAEKVLQEAYEKALKERENR